MTAKIHIGRFQHPACETTHINETSESVSPHSGLGPKGLSKRFTSWMLSYILKNKSLRLLLQFQTLHIYSYYTQRGSSKFIGSTNIPTTQKGNTKIQSFQCFPSSPTLIVSGDFMSGNGCALKGGEATAKPLVPRIDCEKLESLFRCFLLGLWPKSKQRSKTSKKTCPKRTSSW